MIEHHAFTVSITVSEYSWAYWSLGSDSSMANFTVLGTRIGKKDLLPSS